jgi:hypothetical protein
MSKMDREISFIYSHVNAAIVSLENEDSVDDALDSLYAALGTLRDLMDLTCDPETVVLDKREPWEEVEDDND